MLFDFRSRVGGSEMMDDFDISDERLRRALIELPRLNRMLGGYAPVRRALLPLLQESAATISVLDVGSGIGDLPIRITVWAGRVGASVHVTATDANPVSVGFAEASLREPRPGSVLPISFAVADAMDLPYDDNSFDVVTASQLLHHFSSRDAAGVLTEMGRVARRLVVVSDLHRNALAWLGVIAITRLLGFGAMVRADGPVSVRKGFVRADLEELAASASLRATVRWHPLFRWSLTAECDG
jgi:SAM-dependent methyltransferase